ncbi:ligase-associated DNA damage response exonuclease [Azospirillum doebereinerae]|uniref:Ligase-associated DNA damage response exonuclease n=1 Tax=Azospirillum doebereinerae TaxID=92933 RepID=A0A433JBE7_9PROT|nr:ligase-associated DNA damage response exonuclease [Azospirillum doebereinerae]MCG5242765.1 ligase-associated DNA damage response exonuclease [Azospirillum doebereinerae]RUQ73679.1 ligase-associated DNA damage response exonuclease [Azospirillum doebereinerae]
MPAALHPERLPPDRWIKVLPEGLYVEPGGFHIDPVRGVERAVITHGHSDHARPGNQLVFATPGTLAIMAQRMGEAAAVVTRPLDYGETIRIGAVTVRLVPAGHVLGSAQVVMEYAGSRVVVSGDYKRRADRTCLPFEPVPCDVFVTEATFGLPVFRHPPDLGEVGKLLHSLTLFPERSHVVGVYALGKCQRVITLLRAAGYDGPIHLHGALEPLCALYERHGVALGELRPATVAAKEELKGALVLAPPAAATDRWARRLTDPVVAMASGWMRVRQRARQRGVELPLIISDHADWDELTQTLEDVAAPEVWVTHGREEALVHHATQRGIRARALALIGFEEEEA